MKSSNKRGLYKIKITKKFLGKGHPTSNENLYAYIVEHSTHMHTQSTVGLVVQEALITIYNPRTKQTKNYVYTSSFHWTSLSITFFFASLTAETVDVPTAWRETFCKLQSICEICDTSSTEIHAIWYAPSSRPIHNTVEGLAHLV